MNCSEIEKLIKKYIAGEINQAELDSLFEHTADCPKCSSEVVICQKIETLVKGSFPNPEGFSTDIMDRIGNFRMLKRSAILSYLKCCAAFLFVVFFLGSVIYTLNYRKSELNGIVVLRSEGVCLVQQKGIGQWVQAASGYIIYPADKICTTPRSSLVFEVAQDSIIEIGENSMLVLKSFNGVTEFFLDSGSLKADLRSPHGPFFVTTVNGKTQALGTKFKIKTE